VPDIVHLEDLPKPPRGRKGWPWTEAPPPAPLASGPAIAIVTPSFNQGAYLEETLRSVLLQGYPKLKYTVVDGGSTDGSVDVLRRYERWLDGWVSEPDRGQSHAINKGLQKVDGDLANWLNSDDVLAPGALATIARAWDPASPNDVLVGHGVIVDTRGKVVFEPQQLELDHRVLLEWISRSNFMQPSCFFPLAAVRARGGVDERLRFCMDVDLWLRLARDRAFRRIRQCLSYSKSHGETKTNAERYFMHAETLVLVARHGGYDVLAGELDRWARRLTEMAAVQDKLGFVHRLAGHGVRSRLRKRKPPAPRG